MTRNEIMQKSVKRIKMNRILKIDVYTCMILDLSAIHKTFSFEIIPN